MSDEERNNHKWNHSKLSRESKEFLSKLKLSESIEIEGKIIYITHYPMEKDGKFKRHIKSPSIEENRKMFEEVNADVFLFGHTHTYNVNSDGKIWFINTGSLGCPMANVDIARAGILEINNGEIEFYPINVKYNVKEIIEKIN